PRLALSWLRFQDRLRLYQEAARRGLSAGVARCHRDVAGREGARGRALEQTGAMNLMKECQFATIPSSAAISPSWPPPLKGWAVDGKPHEWGYQSGFYHNEAINLQLCKREKWSQPALAGLPSADRGFSPCEKIVWTTHRFLP